MILILTITDKISVARKIISSLLKQKLVACANIFPVESSYWWQGKIANAKEYQLILKTKAQNFSKIEKEIKKLHNYEVPEIIAINSKQVGKDYLKWMEKELG